MTDGGLSCGVGCGGLGLAGLLTVAAGGYKGYMDAKGLPIDPASLDFAVTYGGTLLQGVMLSVPGYFFSGGVSGGLNALLSNYSNDRFDKFKEGFKKGGCSGGIIAGGFGATIGALETIVSYAVGYGIGML